MVQEDTWWIVASLVREAALAVRVHVAVVAGVARGGAAEVLAGIIAGVAMLVMVVLVMVAATVVAEETVVMAAMETRMPSPMSPAALSRP
jgi:hypothetical protein